MNSQHAWPTGTPLADDDTSIYRASGYTQEQIAAIETPGLVNEIGVGVAKASLVNHILLPDGTISADLGYLPDYGWVGPVVAARHTFFVAIAATGGLSLVTTIPPAVPASVPAA